MPERDTTYDRAVDFLKAELADGEKPADFLFEKAASKEIQERTLRSAKQALAIPSFKRDKKWFWGALPQQKNEQI